MMGYDNNMKDAYRLWSLERSKFIVSRNVVFQEDKFPFRKDTKSNGEDELVIQETFDSEGTPEEVDENVDVMCGDSDRNPERNDDDIGEETVDDDNETLISNDLGQGLRRSGREKKAKVCGCCNLVTGKVPNTVQDAMNGENSEKWKEAMDLEMNEMAKKEVWDIVERPSRDKRVIGAKWVFAIKNDKEGNVSRYKARLVAQGFKKTMKMSYEETFSPVMYRKTMRILLAIAAHKGWIAANILMSNVLI